MEKVMESHGILTGHKCTNPVNNNAHTLTYSHINKFSIVYWDI